MNKKGMTLIEMVVSILILSISTLTLLGGFSAVMRIMGNSSRIKNNSDMLLSYAEGETKDKVEAIPKTVKYSISSTEGTINVSKGMKTLNVKGNDEVYLRVLDMNHGQTKVKNTEIYKNFKSKMDILNKELSEGKENELEYSSNNGIIKSLYFSSVVNQEWSEFPKVLLPKTYSDKLAANSLYVFPYYPWEISKGDGEYQHGGLLISLNKNKNMSVSEGSVKTDYVHIVYDYENDKWYYNSTDNYEVTFKESSSDGKTVFDASHNGYIKSWIDFKDIIINPDNGWKVLDIEAEYDEANPDSFWKDVQ